MGIFRIVYFSENHLDYLDYDADGVKAQLETILKSSQSNNERDGITGALIFDDLWFIQVLEGDRETVWKTFDRIRSDGRHHGVTIVDARDVEAREFGEWSMALITRNAGTAALLDEFGPNGKMSVRSMKIEGFLTAFRRSAATVCSAFAA
jgi:hypothetical protein